MAAPDAACRPRVEPQKADFADASRPPYFITLSTGCSSHFPNRFFCGTVFTLDAVGNFSVLHRFDCFDGARPYPRLVRDGVGNPYGTTESGGAYPCYFGTLFKVGMTGGFSVLHSFTGGADGGSPQAGLTQDAAGNLYGAVPYDGASGFGARSSS